MKRVALVSCCALLAAGCAAHKPMAATAAPALRGRNAATTVQKAPSLAVSTPGAAMFGLIGALATAGKGDEILKANNIEDPAFQISRDLAKVLQEKYGFAAIQGPTEVDLEDAAMLSAARPGADLLLDVKTTGWHIIYFPASWGRYRVIYEARARLIDAKTKEVLAEGTAKRVPDDVEKAPSYDELLENGAARLKAELKREAAECTEELAREIFGVGPTATKTASAP